MEFYPIAVYDNYIDAHIAKGQLEESGVTCWLQDENTLSVNPMLNQALGGIKLMVAEDDVADAQTLLAKYIESRPKYTCPVCGSHNIDFVTTPRKASNWFFALIGAIGAQKVYHCFDCGHETANLIEPV